MEHYDPDMQYMAASDILDMINKKEITDPKILKDYINALLN